jgi:hypothetical protein
MREHRQVFEAVAYEINEGDLICAPIANYYGKPYVRRAGNAYRLGLIDDVSSVWEEVEVTESFFREWTSLFGGTE